MDIRIRRAGAGLVLLLILVNVWKWWPSMSARLASEDTSGSRLFSVEDFKVYGSSAAPQSKPERDLFRLGGSGAGMTENAGGQDGQMNPKERPRPPQAVAVIVPPAPPPPSPEELAAAASRAMIAQIKCIGVLFQENKKPEAYLVRGDQHFILRPGEVFGEQLEVEKITLEAIHFKDRQTGVTGVVPVDGKEGGTSK